MLQRTCHPETSIAVQRLMAVYQTTDPETVFVQAYHECVGTIAEHARFDFRLYRDGRTGSVPPYIERACRYHRVWPWPS